MMSMGMDQLFLGGARRPILATPRSGRRRRPAVSTTARPRSRACAAIRGCGTNVGHVAPCGVRRRVGERPEVVESLARGDRDGVDPALARTPRRVRPRRSRVSPGDSRRRSRRARRARAACRPAARGRRRRERSGPACRAGRRAPAARAAPRCRRSSPECARRRCRPRPAPRRSPARARRPTSRAGQRRASGAPYSTALAETKIAKSYDGQRRVSAGERRRVAGRQDRDRREDHRRRRRARRSAARIRQPAARAA